MGKSKRHTTPVGRNASPSLFGWDFQINAAICLMIENIQDAVSIRVEGEKEDIEITLPSEKIYAQAKAFAVNPDDIKPAMKKLKDALISLNDAANSNPVARLIYITNGHHPFGNRRDCSFFDGKKKYEFGNLPEDCKTKINNLLTKRKLANIVSSKLHIYTLPFIGDVPNCYSKIIDDVTAFLSTLGVSGLGIHQELLDFWQKSLFGNATTLDLSKLVTKKKFIWPLIVLVCQKYFIGFNSQDTFDEGELQEIYRKYAEVISFQSEDYSFFTQVISDFDQYLSSNKSSHRSAMIANFITDHWHDYKFLTVTLELDTRIEMGVLMLILEKILHTRFNVKDVFKKVNL